MKFIVNNFTDVGHQLGIALRLAGEKMRGEDANRGLNCYPSRQEFEVENRWFDDNPVNMRTVAKALKEHTGVEIKYTERNGNITVTDFNIQNKEKYEQTVGKISAEEAEDRKSRSTGYSSM